LYMPDQYPGLSEISYWIIGTISSIILFASVLLHELAHSYVAKRRGLPVAGITLFLFGGVSQIMEEPTSPELEFKLSFAGPASSLLLAGVFGLIWLAVLNLNLEAVSIIFQYAALINLILAIFNLIPAFPMDGGRIFRAALWRRKGDFLVATKISTKVGEGFAYLFMIGGFFLVLFTESPITGIWLIFIGWFLKSGAEASLRQTVVSSALSNVKVGEIMSTDVHSVEPDISLEVVVDFYFFRYKHGGYPVLAGGKIIGMVTLHDIKQIPKEKWRETKVRDIMVPVEKLATTKSTEPALDALIRLANMKVGRLPVMDGDKLVGIVTRSDIVHTVTVKSKLASTASLNISK
jgi:Zn-dependent protease/predicted transcriptional regulator